MHGEGQCAMRTLIGHFCVRKTVFLGPEVDSPTTLYCPHATLNQPPDSSVEHVDGRQGRSSMHVCSRTRLLGLTVGILGAFEGVGVSLWRSHILRIIML